MIMLDELLKHGSGNYSVEVDSDLIGKDFDDIDPFGEDKFEYEDVDDDGILYE